MALELPQIDVVKILEESGVIAKVLASFNHLLDQGTVPGEEEARAIFAEAMAGAPGAIQDALVALPVQLLELVVSGRGPITHDPSAMA